MTTFRASPTYWLSPLSAKSCTPTFGFEEEISILSVVSRSITISLGEDFLLLLFLEWVILPAIKSSFLYAHSITYSPLSFFLEGPWKRILEWFIEDLSNYLSMPSLKIPFPDISLIVQFIPLSPWLLCNIVDLMVCYLNFFFKFGIIFFKTPTNMMLSFSTWSCIHPTLNFEPWAYSIAVQGFKFNKRKMNYQ